MRFKRAAAGLVASVMALTATVTPLTDNLPLLLLSEGLSVTAGADRYGDYAYMENNGVIWITAYYGEDTSVVIPSEIYGKPVRDISSYSFSGCDKITSITIPDTVTYIGQDAFVNCTS